MLVSARTARRAVAGAVLFGAQPSAMADDLTHNPPNCTAAELAGVSSGGCASTSAQLFTHPDVNWFFTGLGGLPRDQVNRNPDTKADLTDIRQPLVDLKNRCGAAPAPMTP
jgi:hemophore-related protein